MLVGYTPEVYSGYQTVLARGTYRDMIIVVIGEIKDFKRYCFIVNEIHILRKLKRQVASVEPTVITNH